MGTSAVVAERRSVRVPAGAVELDAIFERPAHPRGVVVFAHAAGPGRMSARNRFVAIQMRRAGFATVQVDLLSEVEALDPAQRAAVPLHVERLQAAMRWAHHEPVLSELRVALFGTELAAAAAFEVSAHMGHRLACLVSRSGRLDLVAATLLPLVTAPTLLIVGGEDAGAIELNESAYESLRCEKSLSIVPGASGAFEEPGALESMAGLATEWLVRHLRGARSHAAHVT